MENRDFFRDIIQKSCIGPGASEGIFICNPENEILLNEPSEQYYSGILFPSISKEEVLPENKDLIPYEEETSEEIITETEDLSETEGTDEAESPGGETEDNERSDHWAVNHYRDHLGMIFQLNDKCTQLEVTIKFGKYTRLSDLSKKKIRFSIREKTALDSVLRKIKESGNYESFKGLSGPIEDILVYSPEKSELAVSSVPKYRVTRKVTVKDDQGNEQEEEKTEEKPVNVYGLLKNIKPGNEETDALNKLFMLLRKAYRREDHNYKVIIATDGTGSVKTNVEGKRDLPFYLSKYFAGKGNRFAKVIIINPYKVKEEDLNEKIRNYNYSLFQSGITVRQLDNDKNGLRIPAYTELISNSIDEEQNTIEYVYQDVKSYGKGINCAVTWEETDGFVKSLSSSFLPETEIKDFSLDARTEKAFEMNPEVLKLKNLSHWGWEKEQLIKNLKDFTGSYEKWNQIQVQKSGNDTSEAKEEILQNQQVLLGRLLENVRFLESDPVALECFRKTNTAMYLQMIIARDKRFEKNRDLSQIMSDPGNNNYFNDIEFFKEYEDSLAAGKINASYRPFQLAFLLMNIKPSFVSDDPFRNIVDLIWFPTGGGKTEAYLALTALTIIARRQLNKANHEGVSVIMRYTLRLLASQQFERASFLICALEFLRANKLISGEKSITSGMWVGQSLTPNKVTDLKENPYKSFTESVDNPDIPDGSIPAVQESNPYPVICCPWCGCKLVTKAWNDNTLLNGYADIGSGNICCVNENCHFGQKGELPVCFIDDFIYRNPPALLFGTVDKFAMLSNKEEGHKLFQSLPGDKNLPPDLIIQDELHLISGPIGSMVGLFETIIEELATKVSDGKTRKPKIVASTATIRNTKYLINRLYNREVAVFPAQGIRYDDNFYSVILKDQPARRKHIGIVPTGKSSVDMEINMISCIMTGKVKFFEKYINNAGVDIYDQEAIFRAIQSEGKIISELDNYWTILCYYNSLKDLGRTKSRVPQEIAEKVRAIRALKVIPSSLDFLTVRFYERCDEFTSRAKGAEIKKLLKKAESEIRITFNALEDEKGRIHIDNEGLDLALASNMISVGIDVPRFNLMLFAGQPRSFSEYIQSSSRVARSGKGLVVNILNPFRNRELSLFENFVAFHQGYYKYVEPLSATPFTENVIDRLLNSLLVCYVRHKLGLKADGFRKEAHLPAIKALLLNRCGNDYRQYISNKLDYLCDSWKAKIERSETKVENFGPNRQYPKKYLIDNTEGDDFDLMMSLRDVEPDCYIEIENRL